VILRLLTHTGILEQEGHRFVLNVGNRPATRHIPEDWNAPKLVLLTVGICIKILHKTFIISVGMLYPVCKGELCFVKRQVTMYIFFQF
jgi:hypothetical protein